MKRFFAAIALCTFLLGLGVFILLPKAQAEDNILQNLLNLPSPPPPNPLISKSRKNRPESFYDIKNPPKDDAPIEDLIDYWQYQSYAQNAATRMGYDEDFGFRPEIPEKTLKRLYEEVENNPEKINGLLKTLPKNQETVNLVKNYYDKIRNSEEVDRYEGEELKNWLTYNSNLYSDELLEKAKDVKDSNGYVENYKDLLALAEVDWEKAKPLLESLANNSSQPVSQTAAYWAFYKNALKEKNSIDADNYRRKLQQVVENKSLSSGNRDLAMDAIVEGGDFDGREDWYFSLYEDETLFEMKSENGGTYSGLMTMILKLNPDKYRDKLLGFLKSNNQNVRNVAVMNLISVIDKDHKDVIEALLPWLENPKWAKESRNERQRLIQILSEIEMPESVPGLISIMNEKVVVQRPKIPNANTAVGVAANTAAGVTMMPANVPAINSIPKAPMVSSEETPFRYGAIRALAKQKDMRAVPALKQLFSEVEYYEMSELVRAVNSCKGFSVFEQVEALEKVARASLETEEIQKQFANRPIGNFAINTPAANMIIDPSYLPNNNNPESIKLILGTVLSVNEDVSSELVSAVINKISALQKKEPKVANALREIVKKWSGKAVNSLLMREVKENRSDTDSIVKLLALRKDIKENQIDEVYDMRNGNSIANGISACILEENSNYDQILAGENIESKTAMLACARLIRAELPIEKVAENLRHQNKDLAMAAERYIESVDTFEARQMILALYPNKAKILGARGYFKGGENAVIPDFMFSLFESVNADSTVLYNSYAELEKIEKTLQKELADNPEMIGAYSLENNFVRVYKDKAVFSWEEDSSRYRERTLKRSEFKQLVDYVINERLDELPPFIGDYCEEEHEATPCDNTELLMLTKDGGRRIFVNNKEGKTKFINDLNAMFTEMKKSPAKLKYWMEKSVTGLEILFEDENLKARTVWKNGDDFRLLIDDVSRRNQIDKEIQKQNELEENNPDIDWEKVEKARVLRYRQREYENYSWRKFEQKNLADIIAQPDSVEYIPKRDNLQPLPTDQTWKARTTTFELRADEEGLYKISRGVKTKIRNGNYSSPVVTANGRWALVVKYTDYMPSIVRVNLLTNKEFKVTFPSRINIGEIIAFVPSLNKVLAGNSYFNESEELENTEVNRFLPAQEQYFVDAETGIVQKAKGEIRPFFQESFRPLQSNGKPDEFWVAIPSQEKEQTQIGIFNAKTLTFKSLQTLPKIRFNSMEMWVDEKDSKIYFVYEGHLLSFPVPKP